MGQRIKKLERDLIHLTYIEVGATTFFLLHAPPAWDKDLKYVPWIVAGTLAITSLNFLTTLYQIIDKKLLGAYKPFQINLENKVINEEI